MKSKKAQKVFANQLDKAFEQFHKVYPDLDRASFEWGYIAGINDMIQANIDVVILKKKSNQTE